MSEPHPMADATGGGPAQAPVALLSHPDVQRQILTMDARAHLLATLIPQTAVLPDQSHAGLLDQSRAGDARAAASEH